MELSAIANPPLGPVPSAGIAGSDSDRLKKAKIAIGLGAVAILLAAAAAIIAGVACPVFVTPCALFIGAAILGLAGAAAVAIGLRKFLPEMRLKALDRELRVMRPNGKTFEEVLLPEQADDGVRIPNQGHLCIPGFVAGELRDRDQQFVSVIEDMPRGWPVQVEGQEIVNAQSTDEAGVQLPKILEEIDKRLHPVPGQESAENESNKQYSYAVRQLMGLSCQASFTPLTALQMRWCLQNGYVAVDQKQEVLTEITAVEIRIMRKLNPSLRSSDDPETTLGTAEWTMTWSATWYDLRSAIEDGALPLDAFAADVTWTTSLNPSA